MNNSIRILIYTVLTIIFILLLAWWVNLQYKTCIAEGLSRLYCIQHVL